MEKAPKYFIVDSSALPEIFRKVAEAKRMLETGETDKVNVATKARHLGGKFVCQPHDCQKFLPVRRQRVDHCRGEHFENIRACVWEPAALGKRAQVQIDCREPALARPKKRLQLLLGKLCAAAVGIDGKLGVVEPQVLHADLVQISAQADNLARGQEPVAAGNDQVRILGQARADAADEAHGALVAQQMKICIILAEFTNMQVKIQEYE